MRSDNPALILFALITIGLYVDLTLCNGFSTCSEPIKALVVVAVMFLMLLLGAIITETAEH